jgi:tight adherence protein B
MGIFTGLLLGIGLFLCLVAGPADNTPQSTKQQRLQGFLTEAQLASARPVHLVLASAGGSLLAGAIVLAVSSTWSVAIVFAVFGAAAPWLLLRRRVIRGRRERRELWPYVIDDLASGIRAGLSLPEAVAAVAERGPRPMRPAFAGFASNYRATGSFTASVDVLAERLADPVADRVVEALLLAREVGGTDVGRLLRGLGQALRDDARARGEIEARQSWTVNGARLAVCAPWAVLLLLASRSKSIQVYDRPAGLLVLAIGGGLSALAYVLMRRIGKLPDEQRTRRSVAAATGAEA